MALDVNDIDFSKIQTTSLANSLKNDSIQLTGTIDFPTSIAAGTFVTTTTTVQYSDIAAVTGQPVYPIQFSDLLAYFQEDIDSQEQYFGGPTYNGQKWYKTSVNTKIGFIVTAPAPNVGPGIIGLIYPVIGATSISVVGLVFNPYANGITLTAVSVPWKFVTYSLTN